VNRREQGVKGMRMKGASDSFSAPQIRSTILALYKLLCTYVCKAKDGRRTRKGDGNVPWWKSW